MALPPSISLFRPARVIPLAKPITLLLWEGKRAEFVLDERVRQRYQILDFGHFYIALLLERWSVAESGVNAPRPRTNGSWRIRHLH